jgi:hypothetical protein
MGSGLNEQQLNAKNAFTGHLGAGKEFLAMQPEPRQDITFQKTFNEFQLTLTVKVNLWPDKILIYCRGDKFNGRKWIELKGERQEFSYGHLQQAVTFATELLSGKTTIITR